MEYTHTQTAYRIFAIMMLSVAIPLVAILWLSDDAGAVSWLTAVIVVIVAALLFVFSRLTVTIASGTLVVAFGRGWPRRTTDLHEIVAVRQVRNSPYQGWGVRKIKDGWMYNVWGLDAVELDLSSGKKFRIGTDDPERLLAAVDPSLSL